MSDIKSSEIIRKDVLELIAYLFPGQGSQKAGMYDLLGDKKKETEEVFETARAVTGRDVIKLCKDLTDEELKQTYNTQLCVTAMNMAYAKLLANQGIVPDIVAGHSLGQLSALAAAEVITLQDLFRIVEKRAELMMKVQESGKLATIIGLDKSIIEEICKEVSRTSGTVSIALENSDIQYVIGGREKDVDIAVSKIKAAGALKIVELRVSNAFHTYLMEPMVQPFSDFMNTIVFHEPKAKVLLNAKGDFAGAVEEIKKDIIDQCVNPVKWKDCMHRLLENEDILVAEVGIGKTMSSLMRGMPQKSKVCSISNHADFDKFLSAANKS